MRRIKSTDELRLFYNSFINWEDSISLSVLGEKFESLIEDIYHLVLEIGDSAVDMGSHFGRHALPMARRIGGTGGNLFAFDPLVEPNRQLNLVAQEEQLNKIIITHDCALSDYNGSADFIQLPEILGYSTLVDHLTYPIPKPKKIINSVSVVRLDDVLIDYANTLKDHPIKFIKADLEGGEFHALKGASKTIVKFKPIIIFENMKFNSAQRFNYSKINFFDFFESIGYNVFDLTGVELNHDNWDIMGPWYSIGIPVESANKEKIYCEMKKTFKEKE